MFSIINPKQFYIGSAINIYKRRNEHLRKLKANRHINPILQKHYNKYGADFEFEVLEVVEQKEDLLSREQYYLDTLPHCFNICKVAGNTLGVTKSDEARKKMSAAHKGKVLTEEHKKKCSEALKGRKFTEEHRARIGAKSKGHKRLLGYKHGEETRKRNSARQMGHPVSEATREKLRQANLGKRYSPEVNKKKGKTPWNKGMRKQASNPKQLKLF